MKQTFIMTASSKGGVGKSTAALGISRALIRRGRSVLLCDLDFGNACLDILTGCEDSIVYTVFDAARGACPPEKAVIELQPEIESTGSSFAANVGRLLLLPAPAGGQVSVSSEKAPGAVTPADVAAAVQSAAEYTQADFVVMDTGAGVSGGAAAAASLTGDGLCIVIASHNPTSLRAAENTAARLLSEGAGNVRLIINSFDAKGITDNKQRTGLLDMIDSSRVALVGVVPYDYSLMTSQESGKAAAGEAHEAYNNIAARICGENVPLFSGIKKLRKKRKKLFT